MKPKMEFNTVSLAVIGVDIGKEVFHIVGLGVDGKIAFRRKINLPERALRQQDTPRVGTRAADHPGALRGWRSRAL